MQIIAHRGFWLDPSEKNTSIAFTRALNNGFGIETDFRDLNGELVVSHDLPGDDAMPIRDFISLYVAAYQEGWMALNIKADGLQLLIKKMVEDSKMHNYFVFDMAVPDMRGYFSEGVPTFTRLSEYEQVPSFLDNSIGVWLDAFEGEWYDRSVIRTLLERNKQVAFVSPELHGRPHHILWNFLKANQFHQNPLILLCTDFPLEAKEYFHV
jgi:glycerophosphoryl diester phosphodiesterase